MKSKKEEIQGLTIEEKEYIPESFGIEEKVFSELVHTMGHYFEYVIGSHQADSKVAAFRMFLQSEEFKKVGYELDSSESYLMLGFAWDVVLNRIEENEENLPLPLKGGGSKTQRGKSQKTHGYANGFSRLIKNPAQN